MYRNYLLKLGLPVGLLIMAGGYFVKRITQTHLVEDFVIGFGFAIVFMTFIIKLKKHRTS